MRLYLSSFRLGDHPEHLLSLTGGGGGRAAVIGNAIDDEPDDIRRLRVGTDLRGLSLLGFSASELDLRDYFGAEQRLRAQLSAMALVWLRGGNTFLLRYALRHSGADSALRDLLASDALVYGGYSAGCCVLAPSLRGLEVSDDPGAVRQVYGSEPLWDGLGLIDEAIVPHYGSDGLGGEVIRSLAQRYRDDAVPYRALRDGQVLIVNGAATMVV